ncbi:MAG: hypothetical protein ACKPBB_20075 [Sphaerospermopsis kisseleviana]
MQSLFSRSQEFRSQESGVVRAKHSADKLSILITGYFPNASPLLRPYFARTGGRRQKFLNYKL